MIFVAIFILPKLHVPHVKWEPLNIRRVRVFHEVHASTKMKKWNEKKCLKILKIWI